MGASESARTLKERFVEKPAELFECLTFGELEAGDKFIALPIPGDNEGHGGFRIAHNVFVKINSAPKQNATELKRGILSTMSDLTPVIKLNA